MCLTVSMELFVKQSLCRWTFAVASLLTSCTVVAPSGGPGVTQDTALGPVLVDAAGMTLYTYDGDLPDKPNCYSLCSVMWPALEAAADAQPKGEFTIVNRATGVRQWEYRRAPLYTYRLDSKPGDIDGDGEGGTWHAAKP